MTKIRTLLFLLSLIACTNLFSQRILINAGRNVKVSGESYFSSPKNTSINQFFPIWGITLGETKWKEAEEMGYKVIIDKDDKYITIHGVYFWAFHGRSWFNHIYWGRNSIDFPYKWRGFSWENSYMEWINVFEKMGYKLIKKTRPKTVMFEGRKTLSAEFNAMSPDGLLEFNLIFKEGRDGDHISSRNTLHSMHIILRQ